MRLTLAFLTIAGATFGQSLLLDDFTSGPHTTVPAINAGAPPDICFAPLPAGGPGGPARYTYFTVSALPDYHQTSTLDVSNGFLIMDNGFGDIAGLTLAYGYNTNGTQSPLHLNLTSYDRFRIHFAGGGAFYAMVIYTADGRHFSTSGHTPTRNSPGFDYDIPFTAFANFDPHDIQAIVLEFETTAGPFGISRLEARLGN
jgi:hypothetical protein